MVTKAKQKEEEEEKGSEEEEEEEGGDDKADKESGKSADTGGGLESHIREVVKDAISAILGGSDKAAKSTPATDESSVFRMVKEAQESLKKEEDRENKLKGIDETVETLKKAVEKPPARNGIGGRVSRFMWGQE